MLVNAADAICDKLGPEPDELGQITVRSFMSDDRAVVEIRDSGAGIPADKISQIFDPFFTTKDVGKGTGQGLSIAYDVVANQHQGQIEVSSEPGVGTCFTVCLPMTESVKPSFVN